MLKSWLEDRAAAIYFKISSYKYDQLANKITYLNNKKDTDIIVMTHKKESTKRRERREMKADKWN
jgi:hypothetical protein